MVGELGHPNLLEGCDLLANLLASARKAHPGNQVSGLCYRMLFEGCESNEVSFVGRQVPLTLGERLYCISPRVAARELSDGIAATSLLN